MSPVIRIVQRLFGAGMVAVVLSSCGGGGSASSDAAASPTDSGVSAGRALAVGAMSSASTQLSVASIALQTSTRISRTIWQYTYQVFVANSGGAIANAALTLDEVGQGTSIVSGQINTGSIGAGVTVPVGTVTVQQDRTMPFATDGWKWSARLVPGTTSVIVDSSVPTAGSSLISSLLSPIGEAPAGAQLPVSLSDQTRESMALAVDSNGKIVLAGLVTSSSTTLSADSTALALVRLAIGPIPLGSNSQQINAGIRVTPEYPNLIYLIGQSLNFGLPPTGNSIVIESLSYVVSQSVKSLSLAGYLSSANSRSKTLSVTSPQVTTPPGLPFEVVPDALAGLLPVGIGGTCGGYFKGCTAAGENSAIAVVNSMPIPWTASSLDAASGTLLSGPAMLPANNGALSLLVSAATPWSVVTPVGLSSGGRSINLQLEQTSDNRADSLADIMVFTVKTVLAFKSGGCDFTALKPILKGIAVAAALPEDSTFDQAFGAFGDQLFTYENGVKIAAKCLSGSLQGGLKQQFAKTVSDFLSAISKVKGLVSASQLIAEAAYLGKFWQYPSRTVGVCLDNFGSIRNCVATFTFAPNSLYVTKGVDVGSLATLSAKDINNFDTGTPTGLSWSGNDAGIAIALNNSTGAATAIGLSPFSIPTTITVTDPATAIIGKYDVTVVSPKIDPAQVTISLGQDTTLKLTDGQGHLVAVPAGTTTWTSSDPSKVNCITQIAGFSSCGAGNTTTFRGLAPGTVTVTATDSIAGFTTSAEMTVGDNQLYMYGVVLYAGSNGGTSPGVGSTCSTIVSSITFSGTLKPIPGQPNSYTTTWDHAGSNYGSEYLGYQPYAPNGPVNNLPVVVASNPLTIPNNFQYTESQSKMTGAISLSVPSDSGMGVILGNAMDSELPQFGTCALYWNIKGTVSRTPGP